MTKQGRWLNSGKFCDRVILPNYNFSGVFDRSEDIEFEALKRSTIGPLQTGSKDKMMNGDVFIAKINLEGQQHRLFFEVSQRICD